MTGLWLAMAMMMAGKQPTNLALHRPYTLTPAPNYPLCTDPDDRIQLTDGQYTQGYFWTQKSTVGWRNVSPVSIVVDLGWDAPIAGASFNTAAGVAGVQFPVAIYVLVSVDGKTWHEVGDLVQASDAQNGPPPSQGYAIHRFWTDRWQTHGRFVAFVIIPQGSFCFVDEVEVYEGEASWQAQPRQGEPVTDLSLFAHRKEIQRCAMQRLRSDRERLHQHIVQSDLADHDKAELLQRLEALKTQLPSEFPVVNPTSFCTALPLNDWHARLFALNARLWRSLNIFSGFAVYIPPSPYDPLPYTNSKNFRKTV